MANRLKREREQRRWTRAELARRAAMSAADVGKIEAGRVVPYESQLRKLAKALGLRLQDPAVLLNAESSDE